jgi:hypothetical protein
LLAHAAHTALEVGELALCRLQLGLHGGQIFAGGGEVDRPGITTAAKIVHLSVDGDEGLLAGTQTFLRTGEAGAQHLELPGE